MPDVPPMNALLDRRLPGTELVRQGLADLEAGRESAESLLVEIAAPRLRRLGFAIPSAAEGCAAPGHRLYDRLATSGDPRAAHSAYNALLMRIASYARAAEHARTR